VTLLLRKGLICGWRHSGLKSSCLFLYQKAVVPSELYRCLIVLLCKRYYHQSQLCMIIYCSSYLPLCHS